MQFGMVLMKVCSLSNCEFLRYNSVSLGFQSIRFLSRSRFLFVAIFSTRLLLFLNCNIRRLMQKLFRSFYLTTHIFDIQQSVPHHSSLSFTMFRKIIRFSVTFTQYNNFLSYNGSFHLLVKKFCAEYFWTIIHCTYLN